MNWSSRARPETVWTGRWSKRCSTIAAPLAASQVSRDITTRKRAEDALRQYTVELEAGNAELDAFAHTVAHDLNSPLSIVMGFSQILEENFEELAHDDLRDILPRLSQTSRKMGRIVKELLLLASVRKMDEVDVRVLDMRAIVAETLERFTDLIAATGAEILVPDSWPRAVGHAPWIEEIWSNYISNAIKYGGTPPRVELGADQTGEMVRCWVRDNGAGLAAEQQARLFTEFTRLHTQRIQGHGLGLSIVRRIARNWAGRRVWKVKSVAAACSAMPASITSADRIGSSIARPVEPAQPAQSTPNAMCGCIKAVGGAVDTDTHEGLKRHGISRRQPHHFVNVTLQQRVPSVWRALPSTPGMRESSFVASSHGRRTTFASDF
jgi:light-regulated signal transduction histidine kinase (bacteriophytochrome)